LDEIQIGTRIQILDGSDWHGLFGVVDDFINDIPILYCVNRPSEMYWLYPELRDKVRIWVDIVR